MNCLHMKGELTTSSVAISEGEGLEKDRGHRNAQRNDVEDGLSGKNTSGDTSERSSSTESGVVGLSEGTVVLAHESMSKADTVYVSCTVCPDEVLGDTMCTVQDAHELEMPNAGTPCSGIRLVKSTACDDEENEARDILVDHQESEASWLQDEDEAHELAMREIEADAGQMRVAVLFEEESGVRDVLVCHEEHEAFSLELALREAHALTLMEIFAHNEQRATFGILFDEESAERDMLVCHEEHEAFGLEFALRDEAHALTAHNTKQRVAVAHGQEVEFLPTTARHDVHYDDDAERQDHWSTDVCGVCELKRPVRLEETERRLTCDVSTDPARQVLVRELGSLGSLQQWFAEVDAMSCSSSSGQGDSSDSDSECSSSSGVKVIFL